MSAGVEVKVPDIGDFRDVSVIEVLVKAGDTVKAEQSLITVESDKASMEIPSSAAGVVKEVRVKVGDTVNEGSALVLLEGEAPASAASTPSPAPAGEGRGEGASSDSAYDFDMLVLGAGPGGYSAAFRAADLGLKTVLVERFPTLGGVCLNVGCIPSKALLHIASVMDEARHFESFGIAYGAPTIDLDKLRAHKAKVVGKLTGGLTQMAKMRKVTVVQGTGAFTDPHHLRVTDDAGNGQTISFARAIVAAGSEAVKLPFLPKDDPRVVTSTGALELRQLPKKMLVIGGGIIGLEMGTVYSTLGARLDVVEMLETLMTGADRDLVRIWQKTNAPRFDDVMLKTRTVGAEAADRGITVRFANADGSPAAIAERTYDLVLQAVGRVPNGKRIGADVAGFTVDERGFVPVDVQMRTNVPHIFAIGDIVGQPMLAHKAVHEAHVAAEVAAGEAQGDEKLARSRFDARVIPNVAYTDPEVAWVGLTEDDAKARGIAVKKGLFPWSASGRAIANGREEGATKLLFDATTHVIVGGGIVGMNAGDLISEVALAIEMGADGVDIGKTIHPHPTLGESIGMAAEAYEGVCTDLPPTRR